MNILYHDIFVEDIGDAHYRFNVFASIEKGSEGACLPVEMVCEVYPAGNSDHLVGRDVDYFSVPSVGYKQELVRHIAEMKQHALEDLHLQVDELLNSVILPDQYRRVV